MIDTLAAERHYDRTIAIPAWDAERLHGAPFDEAITDESDRLMDLRLAAEEAMIAYPVPNLTEAVLKLEYARERWDDEAWPDDWWAGAIADIRRLAEA